MKLRLIINEIWDRYLNRVQGDKHWHYEISESGFFILMLIGIILNAWSWVPITIAETVAVGKELWDKFFGREKKFDWIDLGADQIGFGMAWMKLQFAIWVIIWFYRFLH